MATIKPQTILAGGLRLTFREMNAGSDGAYFIVEIVDGLRVRRVRFSPEGEVLRIEHLPLTADRMLDTF